MKRLFIFIFLVLPLIPVANASAYEIDWGWSFVYSQNQKSDNGTEEYFLVADMGIDRYFDKAFIEKDGSNLQLWHGGEWMDSGYLYYGASIGLGGGNLSDWEGTDYTFFVEDPNASNPALAVTNPSMTVSIPDEGFFQMDFVEPTVTGGENPTVTWQAVQNANQYRIRLIDPDSGMFLFNDTIYCQLGQTAYEYTYMGGLFSQYDSLLIRMEARDYDGSQLMNRSRVDYLHSAPVPEPTTMLLLGTGLLGLAGARRRMKS